MAGRVRQTNDAGRIQAFTNYATSAPDVPDQEAAERCHGNKKGAEQRGHGPA
jgi:hypothetical protein